MFDISFAELMVMAVVALLVIGPEKLPKVARTVGAFTGRLQRYVADVKDEISREARFEDLKKLQEEIKVGAQGVESSIRAGVGSIVDGEKAEVAAPKKATKKTAKKASISKKIGANKKTTVKKAAAKKPSTKKTTIKKSRITAKAKTTRAKAG